MSSAHSCSTSPRIHPLALAALAALLAAAPAIARAQTSGDATSDTAALPDDARAELEGIDRISTAATVLYAIGAPLHNAGLGLLGWGALGAGLCATSTCNPDPAVIIGLGAGIAFTGIVMLFCGIGVDVGSGRRRRAWHDRWQDAPMLGLVPIERGALVTYGLTL